MKTTYNSVCQYVNLNPDIHKKTIYYDYTELIPQSQIQFKIRT